MSLLFDDLLFLATPSHRFTVKLRYIPSKNCKTTFTVMLEWCFKACWTNGSWLIDKSIGRLICWLFDWLVYWLISWLISCLIEQVSKVICSNFLPYLLTKPMKMNKNHCVICLSTFHNHFNILPSLIIFMSKLVALNL